MAGLQADIQLRFNRKQYADVLTGLQAYAEELQSNWDGAAKVVSISMRRFLEFVAEEVIRRNNHPYPSTTDNSLSSRTGRSMEQLRSSVKVTGRRIDSLRGQIGGGFPLMYHETGSTTHAKGKLLTIPLPAALDSRGEPIKRNAREWGNTFVTRSKKGNLIIFQRRGKEIVPLYVLKESATLRPRLGLRKELMSDLPYFVEDAMDSLAEAVMRGIS